MESKIDPMLPLDLGDGLILRQAVPADVDALAAFNRMIHRAPGVEDVDEAVEHWTRDLMRGDHPTFAVGDFTIVEDRLTGAIVSSLNLIDQTWTYGGIEFKVGRPELVGTRPDYRKRGLIRKQFEVIHRWSAERGQQVQAITGIPYYYRQFGYEMALPLGGGRNGYFPANAPKLKEGESERFHLRSATDDDIPWIMKLYEHAIQRGPIACVWDAAMWRYELSQRSERSDEYHRWNIITSEAGEPVGYLAYKVKLSNSLIVVMNYELAPGVSWLAITPAIVRHLAVAGRELAARKNLECGGFNFHLGAVHPVYEAIRTRLPREYAPYAWYLRVPDLPDFLRLITPVLDTRLASSIAAGYTGELKISFYRDGLRLVFERGQLTGIESWAPTPHSDEGSAAFPDLTFLQILFGYRSIEELGQAFPDCLFSSDEVWALLKALFPKQNSHIWPIA